MPALASRRTIASAAALAACGGGGGSAATDSATTDAAQGTPLSHDEFVVQADAICQAAADQVDLIGKQAIIDSNRTKHEAIAEYEDTFISIAADMVDQIDALAAPEGETEQVDAITSGMADWVAKLQKDPALVEDPSTAAFRELATDYGLLTCGA